MPTRANFQVVFAVDSGYVFDDIKLMQERISEQGLMRFLEDEVDPYLQDRIDARFNAEGDDASKQWQPLAVATEAIRTAMGYGGAHPINERTGLMHDFLVHSKGDVAALVGGGASLTLPGTGADPVTALKIQAAQEGKSYPPTPPRPVLALSGVDEEDVINDLADYIVRDTMSIVGMRRL